MISAYNKWSGDLHVQETGENTLSLLISRRRYGSFALASVERVVPKVIEKRERIHANRALF